MRLALSTLGLALAGCPAAPSDPPPPPRKAEIVPAPPNARGARAAGTDAAPKPELGFPAGTDGLLPTPSTEAAPDGGSPDDAAPGSPPAPGGPDAPDAGMAL